MFTALNTGPRVRLEAFSALWLELCQHTVFFFFLVVACKQSKISSFLFFLKKVQ
jgi:hypothetical protein